MSKSRRSLNFFHAECRVALFKLTQRVLFVLRIFEEFRRQIRLRERTCCDLKLVELHLQDLYRCKSKLICCAPDDSLCPYRRSACPNQSVSRLRLQVQALAATPPETRRTLRPDRDRTCCTLRDLMPLA